MWMFKGRLMFVISSQFFRLQLIKVKGHSLLLNKHQPTADDDDDDDGQLGLYGDCVGAYGFKLKGRQINKQQGRV